MEDNNRNKSKKQKTLIGIYLPKPSENKESESTKPLENKESKFSFVSIEVANEWQPVLLPKYTDKTLVGCRYIDMSSEAFFNRSEHGQLHIVGICEYGKAGCDYE